MSDLADLYPALLLAVLALLAALAAAPLVHRVGLPGPAAFLAIGVAAGLAGIQPVGERTPLELQQIGIVALFLVLFQGGLSTGWAAWRREARCIVLLGLPGTALTAAGVALAGFAIGLPAEQAVLCGVALAPTDPAAVYATLRGRGASRARTILEGESGFNDPVGIALMVVAVASFGAGGSSLADGGVRLLLELGGGLVGGAIGAALIVAVLRVTPQLDDALQAVAVLGVAVGAAAATASLHGSGFLAIYVAGLLTADRWASQDGRHHAIPQALAALGEPILFGVLGAACAPFVASGDLWRGATLTIVTVVVARSIVTISCTAGAGLRSADRVVIWCGGLKGAVPLLLGTLPALELLDGAERVQAIVLVATAVSIIVQGYALKVVARRMP